MRFLTAELDDPAAAACGRCANCAPPFAATQVDPRRVHEASRFLKRAYRPIEPRKQWPAGVDGHHGKIPTGASIA